MFSMANSNATSNFVFESNTIAYNTGANYACEFMGVSSMSMYFHSINVNNSIFYNPSSEYELYYYYAMQSGSPAVNYSDVRNQAIQASSTNYPILTNCTFTDPLFSSLATFGLSGNSPCIDTGSPVLFDPDGSRKDMGAVPLWKKPSIITVSDVPHDQGLKVEVFWNRSQADGGSFSGGYYSVFRIDNFRSNNGIEIDSPLQLSTLSTSRDIYWIYRNQAYHFMGDVPAFNFENYALVCATLQDSSSTGTHAVQYVVVYRNSAWFSVSDPVSGYSVDNIAPDAVRNLGITKQSGQAKLTWSPVSTGTYNGNSYPELHQVSYKVYCADNADFEISPATYLTTTTGIVNLENILSNTQKFYRIVVSDQ
jgi:hypothetical protein